MILTTGQKMKRLRVSQGKLQSDVAKDLGFSGPAYSKLETGVTEINVSRLMQIAELFQVDPCTLLPGKEELTAKQKTGAKTLDLYTQVIQLQSKLIEAYEKIEELKGKLKV